MFADRSEAGKKLAEELLGYKEKGCIVVAIPRGGVVVADQVARRLGCPLDLIIVRKIGAPGNPELAIGAVAGVEKVTVNKDTVRNLGVSEEYLQAEAVRQLKEIRRRRTLYLGDKPPLDLKGKPVILIDDGLATGYTTIAAIGAVREQGPSSIILAVPVAPQDTCRLLVTKVDNIVCLLMPEVFYAVGQFYVDFSQTTDEEVIAIMNRYH